MLLLPAPLHSGSWADIDNIGGIILASKITKFLRSQPVLAISAIAAIITICIIPPDAGYKEYCSRTVLIQLFCLMTAVAGFRSIGVFEKITGVLLRRAGNLRRLGMIFTIICYFTSMLVTNDVALLTFVPLTLLVYSRISDEKSRICTIVLETAAANLGSMVTPFGNPQNLFIYEKYGLSTLDFFRTMLPAGIISLVMLMLLCLLLPRTSCSAEGIDETEIPKGRFSTYTVLFAMCLLTVFRVIPDWICLILTVTAALILNKKLLLRVDYGLLATFVCFFVFVGNIGRIDTVRDFFSRILQGREVMISAMLSQVISNVPAAVMLSGFTENGRDLLLGVNLGGLGTIIASLASLISFQYYRKSENSCPLRYLVTFSAINFGMLALMLLMANFGVI